MITRSMVVARYILRPTYGPPIIGMKFFLLSSQKHHLITIILRRIVITFSTLVVIFIQVCVHYVYDYHYTLELVKHGVPLAFRSMAVGYTHSKKNFMPMIGGPYVGLSIYLATTILRATFISSGLDRTINMQTKKIPVVITNI
jgi:hypothetical protein